MQDKDSTRSSINKRMNVVHRCIRTPNIVLRALREDRMIELQSLAVSNFPNCRIGGIWA